MRTKLLPLSLVLTISFSPRVASADASRAVAPLMAVTIGISGLAFVADLIMLIVIGDVAVAAKLDATDRQRLDRATGLQVGALVSSLGSGIASGLTMGGAMRPTGDLPKIRAWTIAGGLILTAGAAVMNGVAGGELNRVVGTTAAQAAKAHALAIANYAFAGIVGANMIPFFVAIFCSRQAQAT